MDKSSKNKPSKDLKPLKQPSELHRNIIDTYYSNGFNGYKAVQEHKPGIKQVNAAQLFNKLMKKEQNKLYIQEKRNKLKAITDIQSEQILKELINWAYVDATDFITLTPEEVKELPGEVRRCVQSFKSVSKEYETRDGKIVNETFIELKLIDKTKAIEMINKHIGFYEADNSQKKTISIESLNVDQLNVLNQITKKLSK